MGTKKGSTISLTLPNIARINALYKCMKTTPGRKRRQDLPEGQPATNYTFKMDYFWMRRHRHKSQDSRFWGFVPEDHVVGGAWLIWIVG